MGNMIDAGTARSIVNDASYEKIKELDAKIENSDFIKDIEKEITKLSQEAKVCVIIQKEIDLEAAEYLRRKKFTVIYLGGSTRISW